VRLHRKLREAGVDAVLEVFEGISHAQYLVPEAPEIKEALAEISRFFTGIWAGNCVSPPYDRGRQQRALASDQPRS
jgi:hypothetical protein